MKDIMERLSNKINISKNDIYGLYNGKILDEEMKEDQIIKDENNKKLILIYEYDKSIVNNIIKSNEVICPICKENCQIKIEKYRIVLYKCKDNHETIIPINEYEETQKINISNINEFYKCLNCNMNIFPLCKSSLNNRHNLIKYDDKSYLCNQLGASFFGYCNKCKKNISSNCEEDYDNQGKLLKDKNKILENNNLLRQDINTFNNIIKEIINKLNIVIKNFELYLEINKNIIDNINDKNRNYELLSNIMNINNNDIHNDIKKIINEKDINIQFNNIMNIYNLMAIKSQNNIIKKETKKEILIRYSIEKEDKKIKIFGERFVENNKDKCKYKYENKEYELTKKFDLTNYNKSNEILEIKLIGINNIIDMSYLFDKCESLIEVPDISDWDTSNITNIGDIFAHCKSLKSLPDISKWNTSKVKNMKYIFLVL